MENTRPNAPGVDGIWRSEQLPKEDRIVSYRRSDWHEGARISGGMALATMSEVIGRPRSARAESFDWPV